MNGAGTRDAGAYECSKQAPLITSVYGSRKSQTWAHTRTTTHSRHPYCSLARKQSSTSWLNYAHSDLADTHSLPHTQGVDGHVTI